ncbi:MAG TPA: 4-alpha-glucanotransferase, partial [Ruminococcaceae bacterium]|nr:4-alpha-glucanotransferase [Oscillospiraceae bacterium]
MRASGILLHISSLPSRYGIGTLGHAAYDFVDFLVSSGQSRWQILPVGPTGYGDSPYQSFCAFAGNPYFIDLDILHEQRLLEAGELPPADDKNPARVDYGALFKERFAILRKAFSRGSPRDKADVDEFAANNSDWIYDYAFFMALKERFGYAPLIEWEKPIRLREPAAMEAMRRELKAEIDFYIYIQFLFFSQWENLKRYAGLNGVRIIGDLPIYVSPDSADVWANPGLFELDEELRPVMAAGVPPDGFNKNGQLWGNPVYKWDTHESSGFEWWIRRIKASLTLFDTVRIDHFRGFDSYYSVPFGESTAKNGVWRKGPGMKLFDALKAALGSADIIAEDLGFLSDEVKALLKSAGFPGMKVLQFAFDPCGQSDYLPHGYGRNCVVYTGTHDNDTTAGFFKSADREDALFAAEYLGVHPGVSQTKTLIKAALASVADTAIIPMQDYLELGSGARMNFPAGPGSYWTWRLEQGSLTRRLSQEIAHMSALYGRRPPVPGMRKIAPREFSGKLRLLLSAKYGAIPETAGIYQLHGAIAVAVRELTLPDLEASVEVFKNRKRVYYFSAEFLMGRLIFNNLYCLGILDEVKELLAGAGTDIGDLEKIPDAALGNGGLGRLAACFLDSAATHDIPLDGYGIRYKYGLFKQSIKAGFQREEPDDWAKNGDPWSLRCDADAVTVRFADIEVKAVPYDMPVFGYGTRTVGRLRLWQAESPIPFDFELFNEQRYTKAIREKNRAEDISRVLYPNDTSARGKILRLRQQYFFSAASLADMIRVFTKTHGEENILRFPEYHAVQLNDTHPVVSIPEFIRILTDGFNVDFNAAFAAAGRVFSYTNHTVMSEALETWDMKLFASILPRVAKIIEMLDERLRRELSISKLSAAEAEEMRIIAGGKIHMARLAVYVCHTTNGVAKLHSEILKTDLFGSWHALYPGRFQNKTNGVTQRRWLGLCNPELSALFTRLLGTDAWLNDLTLLRKLKKFAEDKSVINEFAAIKQRNKRRLSEYIEKTHGVLIPPDFVFDVQIKRLHEYKRQFLNAFSILDIYYGIKEGRIILPQGAAFLFAGKAAPGYFR